MIVSNSIILIRKMCNQLRHDTLRSCLDNYYRDKKTKICRDTPYCDKSRKAMRKQHRVREH